MDSSGGAISPTSKTSPRVKAHWSSLDQCWRVSVASGEADYYKAVIRLAASLAGHGGGNEAIDYWLNLLRDHLLASGSRMLSSGSEFRLMRPAGDHREAEGGPWPDAPTRHGAAYMIHGLFRACADYCLARAGLVPRNTGQEGLVQPRIASTEPNAAGTPIAGGPSDSIQSSGVSQTSQVPAPMARKRRQPARLNARYALIDDALRKASEAKPKNHEEVIRFLDGRLRIPHAEPFESAGGWFAGFVKNPTTARVWLSKRWALLNLPAFARGPK